MTLPSIKHTGELQRIINLRRRTWSPEDLASLTSSLTDILRTPAGTMTLRPVQALALHDAGVEGGLFAPIGVGEGKTLLSLLLPVVLQAKRPLLLLPASLIEKTARERAKLSRDWRIPTTLRVFGYEMLGRVQSEHELDTYQPDLIIADEAHRLKNRRAAVTRRVARYMMKFPYTHFCGMSGTVMDKSIKDFAHILRWALKLTAPVPMTNEELEEWAEVLDEDVDAFVRPRAGALLRLCTPVELAQEDHIAARHGFRRRLIETPGVVATAGEGESINASIYVRGLQYDVKQVTEDNLEKLRKTAYTPDDWLLMTAAEQWMFAQQLVLGLHYVWSPRPPDEWREARKAWNSFVRDTISRSRTYDSELHVANACDAGHLDASKLHAWRAVRSTFTPNVVPIWHDDSAIRVCADWMTRPGIVWTEHGLFAEELARVTGAPYFGAKGLSSSGTYIEDADPKSCVIASIDANREGKNLQALWSRNLIVCPPSSAGWWEQVIGRTHRPGQKADEVTVDVLLGCRENFDACLKAIEAAKAVRDVTGKTQKLLLASVDLPDEGEIDLLRSYRWRK